MEFFQMLKINTIELFVVLSNKMKHVCDISYGFKMDIYCVDWKEKFSEIFSHSFLFNEM